MMTLMRIVSFLNLEARHRNIQLFLQADWMWIAGNGNTYNDGKLTHKLTHPSQQVRKKYQVEINEPLENNAFRNA